MTDNHQTRMQRIGYRTPDDIAEPEQVVLVDYVADAPTHLVHFNGSRFLGPY